MSSTWWKNTAWSGAGGARRMWALVHFPIILMDTLNVSESAVNWNFHILPHHNVWGLKESRPQLKPLLGVWEFLHFESILMNRINKNKFAVCFSNLLGLFYFWWIRYFSLLYTYKWYNFRTVCFLAIWYRKRINELRFSESISLSFKFRLTPVTCFFGDAT